MKKLVWNLMLIFAVVVDIFVLAIYNHKIELDSVIRFVYSLQR